MLHLNFKMLRSGFKMVKFGLQMAHLSFQRVPGQDLAENGPFAFKPHKEFIKKNMAFVLENFTPKTVKMFENGYFQRQNGKF